MPCSNTTAAPIRSDQATQPASLRKETTRGADLLATRRLRREITSLPITARGEASSERQTLCCLTSLATRPTCFPANAGVCHSDTLYHARHARHIGGRSAANSEGHT